MFVLAKTDKLTTAASQLMRTADKRLMVWISETNADSYAAGPLGRECRWFVRPATSEDYALAGRLKANNRNQTRPAYYIVDEVKSVTAKKTRPHPGWLICSKTTKQGSLQSLRKLTMKRSSWSRSRRCFPKAPQPIGRRDCARCCRLLSICAANTEATRRILCLNAVSL